MTGGSIGPGVSPGSLAGQAVRLQNRTKRRRGRLNYCIDFIFDTYQKNYPNIVKMKHGRIFPRSPAAFHKWSNEHRGQVWDMIERLGKGEVSHKEAREVLRGEMKALNAISKQVFGFKRATVRR